jgi:hypothetical protein
MSASEVESKVLLPLAESKQEGSPPLFCSRFVTQLVQERQGVVTKTLATLAMLATLAILAGPQSTLLTPAAAIQHLFPHAL